MAPFVNDKALEATPNTDALQLTRDTNDISKSVEMQSYLEDNATELIGKITANSSQAGPSRSADDRLREGAAMVERMSRNGRVEKVDGRLVVTPLPVVTNMRVLIGDIFRD